VAFSDEVLTDFLCLHFLSSCIPHSVEDGRLILCAFCSCN